MTFKTIQENKEIKEVQIKGFIVGNGYTLVTHRAINSRDITQEVWTLSEYTTGLRIVSARTLKELEPKMQETIKQKFGDNAIEVFKGLIKTAQKDIGIINLLTN